MNRITQARPSPAIVVGVLALVAALGGTALAANPTANTSALSKKKVKKITTKQIDKLAPGLSVANAETADTATSADTADSANTADTATSATQAQNASTANGVKPVKVNFAAPSSTPATTFVDQGGVKITGQCNGSGNANVTLTSTANNGAVKLDVVNANGIDVLPIEDLNFDNGDVVSGAQTGPIPDDAMQATLTYRGAGGTTVSGEWLMAEGAAAAQCVIAGTLFVG